MREPTDVEVQAKAKLDFEKANPGRYWSQALNGTSDSKEILAAAGLIERQEYLMRARISLRTQADNAQD